ncbi:hypothetical protein [Rhodococcus erythropolis]|uniref:Conserved hypothetical membrane protein n=1 Tax=Rhodococcus erythropolis (strain PR4 / NBRC 100887) TaxID=234621 RepID=C0ZLQ0_RHOE4|nr:hypothetical protein [Rhodococcus erythropolis]BAH30877.1 conserved hypothetical membrane protein [Rhodococcus erythropolis PR4]
MTSPQPEPTLTFTPKRVAQLAFVLIGCQLVIRAWVAASNYFYWDDLILMGRGGRFPLFSSELLLYDHDGHFMPAAFFFTGLITRIAPYNWALSATLLVIGQAAASLALLRTLRLVLGWRPALLIPLILYLFVPLTLPSFSWWAAALNALPLQIALAWACGDAIKLYRTGHVRYVFSGTAVFVVSLLFFEKAVLVPFVALAFLVLYLRTQGEGTPIRSAVTKCRRLWTACAAVLAIWIPVYLTTVESPITGNGRSMSTELLHHGTSLGMLPTLLGGPWRWERWIPSPAWADPPTVLVAAAWAALLTTVVMTVRARRGAAWIWAAAALYFLASVVAMTATRSDADTTYELAQTLRYFTDSATVFALAAALILAAPRRRPARIPVAVAAGLSALFVVSSLVSTVTFVDIWRENPTRDYLANARMSLSQNQDAPLLEQPVAIEVLLPVAFPNNLASNVLAPLPDRPEFSSSTPILRTIDDSGRIVDAEVTWTRRIPEGAAPNCGTRAEGPTEFPLDGPLAGWEWTVQLNYLASTDGTIDVALESGDAVSVPVTQGLHSAFVRLVGHGNSVKITPTTPGLTLCFGAGQVGAVVPTSAK